MADTQGIPVSTVVSGIVAAGSAMWALILTLRKESTEATKEKVALLEKLHDQKDRRIETQDKVIAQHAEAAAKEDMTQVLNQQIIAMRGELAAQFNARLADLKENTTLVTSAVAGSEAAQRKVADMVAAVSSTLTSIHQDLRGIQTTEAGVDQRLDVQAQKIQIVVDRLAVVAAMIEEIRKATAKGV